MAIRRVLVNGRRVWQARVAYRGARKSRLCDSRDEARQAEAELLRTLKAAAEATAQAEAQPATLRQLFEAYVHDLEARGKSPDTVSRAAQTAVVVEKIMPVLLDRSVTEIGDS